MEPIQTASSSLNYSDVKTRTLTIEDLAFLREWNEDYVTDDATFFNRIMRLQEKLIAKNHVYRCIATLSYLSPKCRKHHAYIQIIETSKLLGPSFSILDLGTCFGQEARALIFDGIHPSSILVTDIHDTYWQAGLELYSDDTESSRLNGVRSNFGDWATPNDNSEADMAVDKVNTFNAVMCMAVLHVLSREQSQNLISRIFRVLKSGGVLFGTCVGSVEAQEWALTPDGTAPRWLHSVESLRAALLSTGFTGNIVVNALQRGLRLTGDDSSDSGKVYLEFSATK